MHRSKTASESARARTAAPLAAPSADAGEVQFRAMADAAPVMLWTSNVAGECTFVNREWLAFTGRAMRDELGYGWFEGVHPDDHDACRKRWAEARAARAPFTLEYRLHRADGQYRWLHCHGSPRTNARGELLGFVGSCADISDRKGVEGAVAETQRRFRALIDNAQDMIYRMRLFPTRAIEYVSGASLAITGHAPAEFYADPDLPARSVHPADRHLLFDRLRDPAELTTTITLRWVHPDGKVVWAEHHRAPVYDASGQLLAIEGIARDLTDRIGTQQRLRESEEQMRQLAARVEAAREDERAALARELHDELGQTLTALKLDLGRAAASLKADHASRQSVDRLQSLVGLVEIGISTIKRISTDLRPPTLDHLGLAAAVRSEATTFRARTGLRCHVRADKEETTTLSPEQQTVLFRVFQEALTNVVRHAQASAVSVRLAERQGVFELRIQDNGRGITDTQIADPRAIGLLGMRERTALIGGTFEIVGRRGKGTTVTARVSIASRRKAAAGGRRAGGRGAR